MSSRLPFYLFIYAAALVMYHQCVCCRMCVSQFSSVFKFSCVVYYCYSYSTLPLVEADANGRKAIDARAASIMLRLRALLALSLPRFAGAEAPVPAESGRVDPRAYSFEDAEAYLITLGIPSGLPELSVKYSVGHWGRKVNVHGSASHFPNNDLQEQPYLWWEPANQGPHPDKFMLLAFDVDDPSREGDGSKPGRFGPYLTWAGVNCEADSSSCYHLIPYEAPAPPKGTGKHRIVFLLFQQTSSPPGGMQVLLDYFSTPNRKNWDAEGFLEALGESAEAVSMNFLYASDEGGGDAVEAPGSQTRPPGISGLGPAWDQQARPKHEEL